MRTDDEPSLQEGFMDYCTFRLSDSTKTLTVADKYWHSVTEIKALSGQNLHFPILTKLAKAVIVVPHGNADTEDALVMSGRIKRSIETLSLFRNFKFLAHRQFNKQNSCYEFKPSSDLVKKSKNAQASIQ